MNQEEPLSYDPLSPAISLRERELIGRIADQSGYQP
jgi:hypothetical protein